MGAVFSVLAAAMVITGLVSLFKPIPRFRLTTRGRSLILVAVGLALLMVVGRPPQRAGQTFGPGSRPPQQQALPAPPQAQQPPQGQSQPQPGPAQVAPAQVVCAESIRSDNGPPQWHEIPLLLNNVGARQLRFLAAVEDARGAGGATADPTVVTGLRSQRLAALCQAVPEPTVANWVGRVQSMSADSDGRGRLAVEIGNHVVLTTAMTAQADVGADTLIARRSPLYADVSRLSSGDMVVVSGQFIPDQGACVREVGDGRTTLSEPAFLFKFTGIARY